MIRAPDVDEQLPATVRFVPVIREVGEQVRRFTTGADDDLVFAVTELLGADPDRTVVVVRHLARAKVLESAFDRAGLDERALAEPRVELDAHAGQGLSEVTL